MTKKFRLTRKQYEELCRRLENPPPANAALRAFIQEGLKILGEIKIEELSNTKGTGHDEEN